MYRLDFFSYPSPGTRVHGRFVFLLLSLDVPDLHTTSRIHDFCTLRVFSRGVFCGELFLLPIRNYPGNFASRFNPIRTACRRSASSEAPENGNVCKINAALQFFSYLFSLHVFCFTTFSPFFRVFYYVFFRDNIGSQGSDFREPEKWGFRKGGLRDPKTKNTNRPRKRIPRLGFLQNIVQPNPSAATDLFPQVPGQKEIKQKQKNLRRPRNNPLFGIARFWNWTMVQRRALMGPSDTEEKRA